MPDLGNLFSTALTISTVGSLAGVGLMTGTLGNLRKRLGDYEQEVQEKARRLGDAEAKAAVLATDLAALQRIVTGEAHWVKLGQVLDDHHAQAKRHWAKDERLQEQTLAALQKLGGKP